MQMARLLSRNQPGKKICPHAGRSVIADNSGIFCVVHYEDLLREDRITHLGLKETACKCRIDSMRGS